MHKCKLQKEDCFRPLTDSTVPSVHARFFFRVGRQQQPVLIMPLFVVNTNVPKSAVPDALLSEASAELAKAMGKPEQVVTQLSIPRLRN